MSNVVTYTPTSPHPFSHTLRLLLKLPLALV